MAMLPLNMRNRTPDVRKAIVEAKRVAGMLQGTTSLESQGLDGKALHELKRLTILELLASN